MTVVTHIPMPRVSYSQNGEDILLDRVFGAHVGTYMDLGACHPRWDSNTHFFHQRGWHGTNVEPNARLWELFQVERAADRNLNVGVSDRDGELNFYDVVDNIGLSTLDADVAAAHRRDGFQVIERLVQVRSVASLIDEYQIPVPDFLSLDVEAHEGPVLAGIPLSHWRPKILVIESTLPRTSILCHHGWEQRLIELGYIFATFNGVNRFYLRDDLRDKLDCFRHPVNAVDGFERAELVDIRRELEAVATAFNHSHAETALERQQYHDAKRTWDWALQQSQLAQQGWQRECESFKHAQDAIQSELGLYRRELEWCERVLEETKTLRQNENAELERLRNQNAELVSQQSDSVRKIERLRAELTGLNETLNSERASWAAAHHQLIHQVEDTQRHLRPYTLIDHFGVVPSGYGLARRLKHKLATEIED